MTASANTEELPAIKNLGQSLDQIKSFRRRVKRIIESLVKDDKDAERSVDDAYKDLKIAEAEVPPDILLIAERKEESNKCETNLKEIREELEMWKQELPRQIAINLCTAYEVFLREFLAEQVLLKPKELCAQLHKHVGFSETILKASLARADVVECISIKYYAFHAFNRNMQKAYREVIGKIPAEWFQENLVFTEEEWEAAQNDIKLLFLVRNQLIHDNGKAGDEYQKKVADYRERLNTEYLQPYGELMPGPYAILDAPSVDARTKKLDDFINSLSRYADYITKTCR